MQQICSNAESYNMVRFICFVVLSFCDSCILGRSFTYWDSAVFCLIVFSTTLILNLEIMVLSKRRVLSIQNRRHDRSNQAMLSTLNVWWTHSSRMFDSLVLWMFIKRNFFEISVLTSNSALLRIQSTLRLYFVLLLTLQTSSMTSLSMFPAGTLF